jgi:hypothetical protein
MLWDKQSSGDPGQTKKHCTHGNTTSNGRIGSQRSLWNCREENSTIIEPTLMVLLTQFMSVPGKPKTCKSNKKELCGDYKA